MAASTQRANAKRLIQSIADDLGHLGGEYYDRMPPDVRRKVQEVILIKDKRIGASVVLLAKELYSKDIRFIFELLQNADDNHYNRLPAGAVPQVSFSLFKNHLVIECNEDGFNERNLRAICDVGNSSKLGEQTHGYTGEKGIGFKSVFKVAWKVHIQSGPYSFHFIHRPGDIGTGMISPEWVDTTQTLENCNTRITLHLIDDDGAATRRHNAIEAQLRELQNTMLLFLRKLRRINIHVYKEENGQEHEDSTTTLTATVDHDTHRATLRRYHRDSGDRGQGTETLFHVTKYVATGLAKSEKRTYSATEEAKKSYSTAEVILAFPITKNSVPVIEAQQVFAFLPIRRLGFNFLMQADFVTTANREGVVEDSKRNLGLLNGISEAFVTAILQMYHNTTLRYQWMRYLKGLKTNSWDTFWQKLVDLIGSKLSTAAVLEARQGGRPRLISELMRLPSARVDEHGEPLFPDFPGEAQKYLSTEYSGLDLDILSDYGLQLMPQRIWLEYVKHDLGLPRVDSRLQGTEMSDDWHTKTAWTLNMSFRKSWQARIGETELLPILPLYCGKWTSSESSDVFFPTTTSGVKIPKYVDLQILSAEACENEERRKLYANLGVTHASDTEIRSCIIDSYRNDDRCFHFSKSYEYLVFLYETHQPKLTDSYKSIRVQTTTRWARGRQPRKRDVYLVSEDPYSPWRLSQQGDTEWFKNNVNFLDAKYLDTPHPSSKITKLSWVSWLTTELGIRQSPRLVTADGSSLSPLCLHIAEEQPSHFLNFVKYSWSAERKSFTENEESKEAMSAVKVSCQKSESLQPLSKTYLPLKGLQEKCQHLMQDAFFPFLDLEQDSLTDEDARSWRFLSKYFGVGTQDDIRFYIDMLDWMSVATSEEEFDDTKAVVKVYERLYSRCLEGKDEAACKKLVRTLITDKCLIFVSQPGDEETKWTAPEDCRLDAPEDMLSYEPILAKYHNILPDYSLSTLESFFSDVLEIESFDWEDIIHELEHLQTEFEFDFDKILRYYNLLDDEMQRSDDTSTSENIDSVRFVPSSTIIENGFVALLTSIRESFQSESLVFVPDSHGGGEWVEPSECLWSTATEIRGKIILNDHYDENMEAFFVELIGVPRLTAQMVYDLLMQVNHTTHNVRQVKELWSQFNALLEDKSIKGPPEELMQKPIFPIRYRDGNVVLCSSEVEFAIVDRNLLGQQFQDKIKLLDFSLNEAHGLNPLLEWMGLESRYLSGLVREHTFVDGESTYPLRDTTRLISSKAHALTRLAVHSKSPYTRSLSDTQALFDLLRNSKMWETDKICLVLTVNQDGHPHLADQQESEVHITDSKDVLKIFVPRGEVSQEVCFASTFPKELVRWMATDPVTQQMERQSDEKLSQMVTGILGMKSATGMRHILEKEGIVDIEIAEPSLEEIQQIDEDIATTGFQAIPYRPRVQTLSDEQDSSQVGPVTPTTDSGSDSVDLHPVPVAVEREERGDDSITNDTPVEQYALRATPHELSQPRRMYYAALLEHIIRAGRVSDIPLQGRETSLVPATELHLDALPVSFGHPGHRLARECASSTERDRKLGAAGELFTFEMLKSMLHNFDYTCWQSTIRKYVSGRGGHADYVDMGPWDSEGQSETSDIVYTDSTGEFVHLLVHRGYLDPEIWYGRKGVRCYVEVKSTFEPCETPFFVTSRQYNLMSELMTETSIYMIVRVFGLGSRLVGAKVYVDPDRLRREGRLQFSTKTFTVTARQAA